MKRTAFALLTLSIVTALGFGVGCSTAPVDENDPASLYKDAEEEIKSDHYQVAIDKLRMVRNRFPYSKYSIEAQLRLADVYFLQESFGEAASSYETFRDLHPRHEKVPYAMFRIGLSYYKDMPSTVQRDMAPAHKALAAFEDFLKKFPDAADSVEAKKLVGETRQKLAEKELVIGDFYARREAWEAAKLRYTKVVDLYPETTSAADAKSKLPGVEKHAEASAKNKKQ